MATNFSDISTGRGRETATRTLRRQNIDRNCPILAKRCPIFTSPMQPIILSNVTRFLIKKLFLSETSYDTNVNAHSLL